MQPMIRSFAAALTALSFATGAVAQDAAPNVETAAQINMAQQTALRCSAAFAVVAILQKNGEAAQFPDMAQRGREYFVRATANVMDLGGLDRAALTAILEREARAMEDRSTLERTMPPCLLLLDASGL